MKKMTELVEHSATLDRSPAKKDKKSLKKKNKTSIFTKIAMTIILVIIAFPFIWLVISSFKYEKDIISFPPKIFADNYTFENYIKVWSTIPLLDYIKNTVIFSGGVVLTSVFFDSLAGYAFARMNFKGKSVFFYFVLLTMMIPFQVFMIPLFIEINKLGLLDTYAGLIIPKMTSAFGIFMMRSFFVTLPKDLEEAARVDGLNEFKIFLKIMLPLSKPTMLSLAIFTLMNSWNDLLYPLILTSSSKMRTLPAGLALFTGQNISFYGPVMAGTVISMLPLLIIYMFAQKYFVQSTAMSGMKE
ncbi:sugar ABC transporter permease [Enterococcus moraviensis]|nr:sugar ABC transporter permease [Enterococcus moraviensis]